MEISLLGLITKEGNVFGNVVQLNTPEGIVFDINLGDGGVIAGNFSEVEEVLAEWGYDFFPMTCSVTIPN